MNILIKKDLFIKAINLTEKNISRNLSLPILNNILIKTDKNNIQIISTDLEVAISVKIPAKIQKEGSITVQPRILSGILNSLQEENINLKTEKNTLFIEQNEFKTSLKGEDDKEFPILPKINKKNTIEIESETLINSFNQVVNSTASSDLKPELTGVFFNITKNSIKLAATDSFRLSEKTIPNESDIEGSIKFILPSKTIYEIIRSFQDINNKILLFIDDNQVVLQNKDNQKINIQLISKTIQGEYPEYIQIIPKEFKIKTIVSKRDFIQQTKTASLFASRINDIKLTIEPKKIKIQAENYDIGKIRTTIRAATEGDTKEISFNFRYLLDG